jgi:hypothetical protein
MPGEPVPSDVAAFIEVIERAVKGLNDHCNSLKKISARLEKTKKGLKTKPAVVTQIHPLISELQSIKPTPAPATVPQIIESLQVQLRGYQLKLQNEFPTLLRTACEDSKLPLQRLADGFGIGPFEVQLDIAREKASIHYAKAPVVMDLPLDAPTIVHHISALKQNLLDAPIDFSAFRRDLLEAVRVAIARRDGRLPVSDMRAELPAVFREISFIRNSTVAPGNKRNASEDYGLPRFVLELKAFIQSDGNVTGSAPIKLETAVIENTKNPKKSVFIPKDAAIGFGEGTYYQAIIVPQR